MYDSTMEKLVLKFSELNSKRKYKRIDKVTWQLYFQGTYSMYLITTVLILYTANSIKVVLPKA